MPDPVCSSRRSGGLRTPQYYHGHLQNHQLRGLRALRFCCKSRISGGATGFHCCAGNPRHPTAHVFPNSKCSQLTMRLFCRRTFCGCTPKTVYRCRRTCQGRWSVALALLFVKRNERVFSYTLMLSDSLQMWAHAHPLHQSHCLDDRGHRGVPSSNHISRVPGQ